MQAKSNNPLLPIEECNSGLSIKTTKEKSKSGVVAYLRDNKFSCEEADGGKYAVRDQWDGCEGINNGIDVRYPFQ